MFALVLVMVGCQGQAPVSPSAAPVAEPKAPAEVPPTAPAVAADAAAAGYRDVDVTALKTALDAGQVPVLVDVRSAEEYAAGHVKGARNIPVGQVQGRLAELEAYKGGDVYVICQSGGRSAKASATLAAAGYKAVNVTGGTGGWVKKGYPVE